MLAGSLGECLVYRDLCDKASVPKGAFIRLGSNTHTDDFLGCSGEFHEVGVSNYGSSLQRENSSSRVTEKSPVRVRASSEPSQTIEISGGGN